jgi:hypothetical protein
VHDHDDLKGFAETLLVRENAAQAVAVEADVVPNESNALDLKSSNERHVREHLGLCVKSRSQRFRYVPDVAS